MDDIIDQLELINVLASIYNTSACNLSLDQEDGAIGILYKFFAFISDITDYNYTCFIAGALEPARSV